MWEPFSVWSFSVKILNFKANKSFCNIREWTDHQNWKPSLHVIHLQAKNKKKYPTNWRINSTAQPVSVWMKSALKRDDFWIWANELNMYRLSLSAEENFPSISPFFCTVEMYLLKKEATAARNWIKPQQKSFALSGDYFHHAFSSDIFTTPKKL